MSIASNGITTSEHTLPLCDALHRLITPISLAGVADLVCNIAASCNNKHMLSASGS